ncbi:hypothetical protein [Bosea sp. ASV33]|uniref:hypothetical protein n=1 Tax=Bosea sp. ASV33 TaxID=2795106 RepID=UPI0018EA9DA3|nr:hypothetical protein [Bosea sp. ASV33]
MAIEPGTYKADFATALGIGSGIVVLAAGKARGGDSAMLYVGSYKEDGDAVSADLRVSRHTVTPTVTSVFGLDNVTAKFTGVSSGGTISLQGESPQAPGMPMRVTLYRVAD